MGLVTNRAQVDAGIDLWVKRINAMAVQEYRDLVWAIFSRILNQTPQFSGKAVANWNIGVGAPDYSFDDNFGDEISAYMGDGRRDFAHSKGSSAGRKWIDAAKARNRPKMALIQRNTKVYINNNVRGDTDNGKSSEYYLESLQDSTYWARKLRDVNQPYETAQESVMFMVEQKGRLHGQEFNAGGDSMGRYQ